jgi:hypothetical protein
MKHAFARLIVLLCAVSIVAVPAMTVWPLTQRVRTADRNHDGHADVWRTYDGRGQLTEIDLDTNFDGSQDVQEFYQRGVLVRRESDRNFNGQTDLVEELDPNTQVRTRSVIDLDGDGAADLLVLFRDGRPVFSEQTCFKGADLPRHTLPAVLPGAGVHLMRLLDPFAEETSVNRTPLAPSEAEWVGLTTSGGLPLPRFVALARISPSVVLIPSNPPSATLALLLPRAPRAPPAFS